MIFLVTFALPQVAIAVVGEAVSGIGVVADGLSLSVSPTDGATVPLFDTALPAVAGVAVAVAAAFAGAIGWGAAIWAITQSAADMPSPLGEALRAGVRRVWPMFGWYVLYLVLTAVGMLLFVLPGIYVAFAGALFSFAVIYERGRPALVRSFSLVHRAFLTALGRIAALFLLATVAGAASSLTEFWLQTGQLPGTSSGGGLPGSPVAAALVDALVTVLVNIVLVIGLLLTYTQVRARQELLSTGQLWAEANPSRAA